MKEMSKLERQIEKLAIELENLKKEESDAAFDHQRLLEVGEMIKEVGSRKEALEVKWLELSEQVR